VSAARADARAGAAHRAATGLRLPDSIVLDTAVVGGARAILTVDRQLATEAAGRSIACPP
jgi:hypothetical protein